MGGEAAPRLSILVLNYDYGRFLGECLDSLLAQTCGDFEVIVLDDASTDASLETIAPYPARDSRVRVVAHAENRGFTASLLEGTEEHSRGEFVTVVSADDVAVDPRAFEYALGALERFPEAGACFGPYLKLGPGGERSLRRWMDGDRLVPGPEFVTRLLADREFSLLHSGMVIRASSYRRAGGYRRDLRNYVDLAFFLALGLVGPVAYVDRPLFAYRVHPAQLSGSPARRRAMLREGLAVIDEGVRAATAAGIQVERAEARRARVADLALADAFAGRRLQAAMRCGDALWLAPLASLGSRGWWTALARAAIGRAGWRILARWGHRLARSAGRRSGR